MTPNEPGLELHDWETRWSELEEHFQEDAAATLPEACDFIERMLEESELADDVGGANDELLRGYRSARAAADGIERGEDVGPGDVGAAIENLKAVYETLRTSRER